MTATPQSGAVTPTLIRNLHDSFRPISLAELNERAELLERRDSKYVLDHQAFLAFMAHASTHFDILEIDGLRQFRYRTVYFDSPEFHCYQDHNKGRRRRIKVRLRQYRDHGLQFFEVKFKGRRNTTHKVRTPLTAQEFEASQLPDRLLAFCNETLQLHYGRHWPHALTRGMVVDYNRTTLVARHGDERITIDNDLRFIDGERSISMNPQRWIVEVKSRTGVSSIDRWLYRNKHRPVPRCSKYCMGVSLLQFPEKVDQFTPVIRRHF